MFVASGIFDDIKYGLAAAMNTVGLGAYTESLDLLPLALTKPLTGGGARGMMLEIFHLHGPDSFLGKDGLDHDGQQRDDVLHSGGLFRGGAREESAAHAGGVLVCGCGWHRHGDHALGYLFYHGYAG